MEILQLLNILWRRRFVVAASVVFFVSAAVAASVLLPKTWEASTEVLVAGQDSAASLLNDLGLNEMAASMSSTDDIQDKIYLATSRPVLDEVVWRMQLRDEHGQLLDADELKGGGGLLGGIKGAPSVTVTQVTGTDVLQITATGPSPEAAVLMADTLAKVTIDRTTEQARAETREAQAFIQDQLVEVTEELDASFARIAEAQRETEVIDLDSEVRAAVTRLSDLLLEQEQIAAKLADVRARLRVARSQRAAESASGLSAATMTTNPVIGDLRRKLAEHRWSRESLLADHHTERSPEVRSLDAKISATEAELQQAVDEMTAFDPTAATLEADLAGLRQQSSEISEAIDRTTEAFSSYPDKMRALAQLEVASSSAEAVYRSLQDQSFQIGIAEAMTMADLRVVAPAERPDRPASPRILVNLLAGIVLGVGFGGVSALAFEFMDDTVKTAERLQASWNLPILGRIPQYKIRERPALARLAPTDALAEAHRTVRHSIAFASLDDPARRLAVTSATPGEGKSTVAANLAISLAQDGERVLVVDADLRRPTQHRMYPSLVATPGLVEVVSREVSAVEAIQATEVDGVWVLAAGSGPQNPTHVLESRRFSEVLDQLADAYDILLLDAPPVLAVNDPLVIARHADGVVLVVDARRTTRRMLHDARRRLDDAKITPLGAVLNKLRLSAVPYSAYARHYQTKSKR